MASDLIVSELKKHYKDPYNNACAEIKKVLEENGFHWVQGSTYATEGDLRTLFRAVRSLERFSWFHLSVGGIHAFKIEDYSDFMEELKENTNS